MNHLSAKDALKNVKHAKKSSAMKHIKVRLDYKTTIMINRLSSLNVWKKFYPFAQIIN
jgi:hypothetical protein